MEFSWENLVYNEQSYISLRNKHGIFMGKFSI